MDFNKVLSTLTFAGLCGLVILNWQGANELLKTAGDVGNGYVGTVQGR